MKKYILLSFFALLFLTSCTWGSENDIHWEWALGWWWDWGWMEQEVQIFALGDSLTAWYGLPLEASYPSLLQSKLDERFWNYKVINAGVSGNTSAELKWRLDWVLSDANPWDIAILVIGGNDGLRGMSLTDLESNILSIIETLRQKEMRVVFWGMQIPPNLWVRYTRDFETLYKNIARDNRDVYFLEFFLEWVAANRALNLPDMIHPNAEWYQVITENIFNFLTTQDLVWSR